MSSKTHQLVFFDFDGTLYRGDSLLDFCLFFYRKNPHRLRFLLKQFYAFILWRLGRIDTTEFKSRFMAFLHRDPLEKVEQVVGAFWNGRSSFNPEVVSALKEAQKQGFTCILVSASPDVLLAPMKKVFQFDEIIGTVAFCSEEGWGLGINCRGAEKWKRITEKYPSFSLHKAYSDNKDDQDILKKAAEGFVVYKGKISLLKD